MIILNPVQTTANEIQRTLNNPSASLPSLQYDSLMQDYLSLKSLNTDLSTQVTSLQVSLQQKSNELQNLQYEQQELQLRYELEVEQQAIVIKNQRERIDMLTGSRDQG
jgi:hypothetical protein